MPVEIVKELSQTYFRFVFVSIIDMFHWFQYENYINTCSISTLLDNCCFAYVDCTEAKSCKTVHSNLSSSRAIPR